MCTSFQSSYHNVNTYTQYPHFNTIMIIPSEILTTICGKFQIVEILDGNIMDKDSLLWLCTIKYKYNYQLYTNHNNKVVC